MHWGTIVSIAASVFVGGLAFYGSRWAIRKQLSDASSARELEDTREHQRWLRERVVDLYVEAVTLTEAVNRALALWPVEVGLDAPERISDAELDAIHQKLINDSLALRMRVFAERHVLRAFDDWLLLAVEGMTRLAVIRFDEHDEQRELVTAEEFAANDLYHEFRGIANEVRDSAAQLTFVVRGALRNDQP